MLQTLKNGAAMIVGWMHDDIKCMKEGEANVSLALCILVYAESLGRLMKGTLGDETRGLGLCAFTYFLEKIGYSASESATIYRKLRNSMAHSYIPKKRGNFTMDKGTKGIDTTDPNNIKVHLETLIEEFTKGAEFISAEISKSEIANPLMERYQKNPLFDTTKSFTENFGVVSGNRTTGTI
jgi:hypothetical protein